MLKGVIFSLHDVLAKQGPVDVALMAETFRLVRYLKKRGVEPVFVSNQHWMVTYNDSNTTKTFRDVLEADLGTVGYYVGGVDGMPFKPRRRRPNSFSSSRVGLTARSSSSATAIST